jgi:hypothetical protein
MKPQPDPGCDGKAGTSKRYMGLENLYQRSWPKDQRAITAEGTPSGSSLWRVLLNMSVRTMLMASFLHSGLARKKCTESVFSSGTPDLRSYLFSDNYPSLIWHGLMIKFAIPILHQRNPECRL